MELLIAANELWGVCLAHRVFLSFGNIFRQLSYSYWIMLNV